MSLFHNPVTIFFEEKGYHELQSLLSSSHYQKVLIVSWSREMVESEELAPLLSFHDKMEKRVVEFTQSNPNLQDLLMISNAIQDFDFDFVIAIGGGSVIDIAKGLIALQDIPFDNLSKLREIIVQEKYKNEKMATPLLAVPTTSGTGSEVTPWATIWDKELNRKYSISHPNLFAKYALILSSLTMKLPLRPTISTALDALCHATESYWAKKTNPVSQVYALSAIELIVEQFERDDFGTDNYDVRKKLALGSVFAGMAFSNTKTTACHAISYPLTLKYQIDHGIAVSMTLGKMMEINQHQIVDLPKLLAAFKVEKVEQVQAKLITIFEKYNIPYHLHDYHVKEEDIHDLVMHSFTKGRVDNNPVELSEKDIESILLSIF